MRMLIRRCRLIIRDGIKSKTDNDSNSYYIIVNYGYFLLYGSSWSQSQRNFLTLLIYSTALRTYLLSGNKNDINIKIHQG